MLPPIRSAKPPRFPGTTNPRWLRAIAVLMRRPISRQELDSVAGCANGPALIASLRGLGLDILCTRIQFIDRDGRPCNPGVYSFTTSDRRKVNQHTNESKKGEAYE